MLLEIGNRPCCRTKSKDLSYSAGRAGSGVAHSKNDAAASDKQSKRNRRSNRSPEVRIIKERGRGVSGEKVYKLLQMWKKPTKIRIKPERNNPIVEGLYYRANGYLTLFV